MLLPIKYLSDIVNAINTRIASIYSTLPPHQVGKKARVQITGNAKSLYNFSLPLEEFPAVHLLNKIQINIWVFNQGDIVKVLPLSEMMMLPK